jgi:mannose-6-phosphate isomerase-like protein (cupin superfamily)
MLNHLRDAQPFAIPGGVRGVLYPAGPGNQFSLAVVEQDGVYPENGWSINDTCTETLYIIEGSLTVDVDAETYVIGVGDVLSVTPGQKYRIHGTAKTIDVITPAWDKNQNHIITNETL